MRSQMRTITFLREKVDLEAELASKNDDDPFAEEFSPTALIPHADVKHPCTSILMLI